MCFNTVLSDLASNYQDVRDIIISAQIELLKVTSSIIVDICDQVQPQFQTKCMFYPFKYLKMKFEIRVKLKRVLNLVYLHFVSFFLILTFFDYFLFFTQFFKCI